MSYLFAAAGTGGHVYPALAVAQELILRGVDRNDIWFIGGHRLEATVYPQQGFEFVSLELQSLQRKLTAQNLKLPSTVWQATRAARRELERRDTRAVLAMGSYVTVPVGWAAHRLGVPLLLHEQNAAPGLANRLMSRWADVVFASFPGTGLPRAKVVGTPVRRELVELRRSDLRHRALERYGLQPGATVVGVAGGSLGAGALNAAIATLARSWNGPPIQILHLAGSRNVEAIDTSGTRVPWTVVGYEDEMRCFYAAADLVISRAGGLAVAELAATSTPAILVPGEFGGGHQQANAMRAADGGYAVVLEEERLDRLSDLVQRLVTDSKARRLMSQSAPPVGSAAGDIAETMMQHHG